MAQRAGHKAQGMVLQDPVSNSPRIDYGAGPVPIPLRGEGTHRPASAGKTSFPLPLWEGNEGRGKERVLLRVSYETRKLIKLNTRWTLDSESGPV